MGSAVEILNARSAGFFSLLAQSRLFLLLGGDILAGTKRGTRPLTSKLAWLVGIGCLLTSFTVVPCRAGETRITINFTETHDRLGPDPQEGIFRAVVIEATLTSDGHVHEHNVAGVNGGPRRRKGGGGLSEDQNDAKLGDNSASVVWHVKGPYSLQRLAVGKQFLAMANVEIGKDGSCAVEIAFLLQKGYPDVIMRRRDTGEMAHFSLPKVVNSSCSIQ